MLTYLDSTQYNLYVYINQKNQKPNFCAVNNVPDGEIIEVRLEAVSSDAVYSKQTRLIASKDESNLIKFQFDDFKPAYAIVYGAKKYEWC